MNDEMLILISYRASAVSIVEIFAKEFVFVLAV